jgi:hypothetical protein
MFGDVANLGTVALLVALAAVNAALSVALVRWRDGIDGERGERAAVDADADTNNADAATVQCAECGTLNERVYTFCRACVARLPGGAGVAGASAPAPDRAG